MAKENNKAKKSSYGKHSKTYWVVVYLIAAVIVYGIIYFVFIHHSSSTGSSGY